MISPSDRLVIHKGLLFLQSREMMILRKKGVGAKGSERKVEKKRVRL